ncbi:MAG: DUF418 domain-containing protein [Bacteroidaceae bacterium]|nr:DUF418 domain-containing protein [Bacteroidaceae bacterium]
MEQSRSEHIQRERITVIDALRGFALLGVVLVHMQQHYSIFNFGVSEPVVPLFPAMDEWVSWLTQNVLMGKFINIFAFLFGMSFFIQMDRAAQKGEDFRNRFTWRMVVLFIIGVVGSAFYTGDILSIYAFFGLILVLLYPLKNWALLLVACLILAGAPRWISIGYDKLKNPQRMEMSADLQSRLSSSQMQNALRVQPESTASNAASTANNEISRPHRLQDFRPQEQPEPSFWHSVRNNLTNGRENTLNYQFNQGGRGYLTFALFILGLVVGRIRFFETVHLHRRRNAILFAGFSLGVALLNCIIRSLPQEQGFFMRGMPSTISLVRMSLNDINMVLFSAAITMGFVVLYHVRGIGRCLDILSPYGRMGLTNYEMQGVVGSIVFSLWGFGSVFGTWHATELFLLGIAVYASQIVFSAVWLKYFKYGPLEWLWRSATYLKWQPFRK